MHSEYWKQPDLLNKHREAIFSAIYSSPEAGLSYVEHLCRRAKTALSLSFSEYNYCFALLRSYLMYF